jgi:hypothetical protein
MRLHGGLPLSSFRNRGAAGRFLVGSGDRRSIPPRSDKPQCAERDDFQAGRSRRSIHRRTKLSRAPSDGDDHPLKAMTSRNVPGYIRRGFGRMRQNRPASSVRRVPGMMAPQSMSSAGTVGAAKVEVSRIPGGSTVFLSSRRDSDSFDARPRAARATCRRSRHAPTVDAPVSGFWQSTLDGSAE